AGLLVCLGLLSACAPVLIGGAATTTAVVAVDRRTTGDQVEDKAIELKAGNETRLLLDERPGRIKPSSYAGRVLLVDDVPTEPDHQQPEERFSKVDKVVLVINRLRVGVLSELGTRSTYTWITFKAMSILINPNGVPSLTMTVTT